MWLIAAAAYAQDGCAPEVTLAALEAAATDGRADDGQRLAGEAEAAFACRAATPEEVARLFLAEAVLALLAGDEAGVDLSLAAAGRASPDTWNVGLGPALQARHAAAKAAVAPTGTVVATPIPDGFAMVVDGRPGGVEPAEVGEGLHLLQVIGDGPGFARVVHTAAGELTRVPAEIAPRPAPAPVLPPVAPVLPAPLPEPAPVSTLSRKVPWLVVGLVGAVGAGAAAGGALAQNGAMRDARSLDELDRAHGTQETLARVSYGLLGVSAGGFAVAVVR